MRRLFVLALLFFGMSLIQPLGIHGNGAETLLAFGFLILAAYAAGELVMALRLPKLVGYIIAGIVFGPNALNSVTSAAVAELTPVSSLAIALIAFLAGAELRWSEIRRQGATLLRLLASELGISFVAITLALVAARELVPFLAGTPVREVLAFSLVFASIAVVHSPAVTMALLSETKAQGPVSRTTLGVVLLGDIAVVLLLTATLALARHLVPPRGANIPALTLGAVAWEVGGAVLVGLALGGLVALFLRRSRNDLFLFAIIIAFFGNETARLLHVEPLLTLITAGFVTENFSRPEAGAALRSAMERAAAPVFVVFFALAGAHIDIVDLTKLWPLVLPLAAVRAAAIWAGCRLGLRWSNLEPNDAPLVQQHLWAGLLSQAGVAIGLAAIVAQTYPRRGVQIETLFLALIAVNQAVGAIAFRRALDRSGESLDVRLRSTPSTASSGATS